MSFNNQGMKASYTPDEFSHVRSRQHFLLRSFEQQVLQGLHRIRSLWMATRTTRINALPGLCREFGISVATGRRNGLVQISRVLFDPETAVRH